MASPQKQSPVQAQGAGLWDKRKVPARQELLASCFLDMISIWFLYDLCFLSMVFQEYPAFLKTFILGR